MDRRRFFLMLAGAGAAAFVPAKWAGGRAKVLSDELIRKADRAAAQSLTVLPRCRCGALSTNVVCDFKDRPRR